MHSNQNDSRKMIEALMVWPKEVTVELPNSSSRPSFIRSASVIALLSAPQIGPRRAIYNSPRFQIPLRKKQYLQYYY